MGKPALAQKTCIPCKGGVPPLVGDELQDLSSQLDQGWEVIEGHHLEKRYSFSKYKDSLSFVQSVGTLADQENHHPEIVVAYRKVIVRWWTHKIDGLVEADFIMAAKCDELTQSVE